MKLTFLGHSAFLLESQDVTIAIDPFFSGNPAAPKDINVKPDYILVSHGHSDHVGDAVNIAKNFSSTIVSVFELANFCARQGVSVHPMHLGGSYNFGSFEVKLTLALHGSSFGGDQGPAEYLGNPCGFLIQIGGRLVYHAGDTGLFGDMRLIGDLNSVDVALLPIGDNFTMGPVDALEAVKMLNPRKVIPMHYNTWPLIHQDPTAFKKSVEQFTTAKVLIMEPGDSIEI
ncbi:metal-dependent hydrolase [Desulfotomaculum defluvii]